MRRTSCVSRGVCGIDLRLVEHAPNGPDQLSHVLRENVADRADTETVCVAHLAGIDNEAKFAQPSVKCGKVKPAVRRKAKRRDEMTLVFGCKIRIKA